ncbi:hypothetical protein WISP_50365 [Willisornis vidua]|uniref:Uncharacterized protein n=1 Tax=Willisornis vidua TaxID=1566151 RepID=A0ABQ9DK04_9PASS|nr:hypothetical protein WISP_50365 [Willisornis vidua]
MGEVDYPQIRATICLYKKEDPGKSRATSLTSILGRVDLGKEKAGAQIFLEARHVINLPMLSTAKQDAKFTCQQAEGVE